MSNLLIVNIYGIYCDLGIVLSILYILNNLFMCKVKKLLSSKVKIGNCICLYKVYVLYIVNYIVFCFFIWEEFLIWEREYFYEENRINDWIRN